MNIRKNLPLIVAIALPVLLIVAVMLAVYLPSKNIKVQYNFLYSYQNYNYPYYDTLGSYTVSGTRLEKVNPQPPYVDPIYEKQIPQREPTPTTWPNLYVYNSADDTYTPVSFEDAQKLTLNPNPVSRDGFTIEQSYGGGDIFSAMFGGGSGSGWYAKKGAKAKRLNLAGGYDSRVTLIGWIE